MPTGVSHTFGGHVVVIDMTTEARFDIHPDAADDAAALCEQAAEAGRPSFTILVPAVDGRIFRYDGDPESFRTMGADLRHHAAEARRKTMH